MGIFGQVNGKVAAIGGGVLAAVLVGAVVFVVADGGDAPDPSAAGGQSGTSGASATIEPSATASPFVTVPYDPASIVYPASFDDGIDPEDLPPLAERPGPSYPPAHVMQPWVWDHVGPGWGVAVFNQGSDGERGVEAGPLMLYLLSPEGTFFEVRELAEYVSYGGSVESVSLADRMAVVWVSEEGGTHCEDIDLVTGERLAEYGFTEEGSGGDPGSALVQTYLSEYELWFTWGWDEDGLGEVADYAIGGPGTTPVPVTLPSRDLWFKGEWDERSAFLVSGEFPAPVPSDGRLVAYRLDVVTGVATPVYAQAPSGYDECSPPLSLVDRTSEVGCSLGDPVDSGFVYDYFVVSWDGATPARQVAFSPESQALMTVFEDLGLSLTFDAEEIVVSISDSEAGRPSPFYVIPPRSGPGGRLGTPAEFAPGRFVFFSGDTIVGYDRSTNEVFELIGTRIADTGEPSALSGYVPFGQSDA